MNLKVSYPQHESMLISSFNTYYEQEDYLDLVFICEKNVKVKAHKIVVAAVSDLIKEMLQSTNDDLVFISLPDVSHRNMKLLLNYLYEGLARVSPTELAELKSVLILLKIQLPFANVTTVSSVPNCGLTTENNSVGNLQIKIIEQNGNPLEASNSICVDSTLSNSVKTTESTSVPGPSKCAVAPFRTSQPPPALPISEMYDAPSISKANISSTETQEAEEQNDNEGALMIIDSSSEISGLDNQTATGMDSSQPMLSAGSSTSTEPTFNIAKSQNSLVFGGLSQNFFISAPQAASGFSIQQSLEFQASNLKGNQQKSTVENIRGNDDKVQDVIIIEDDDDDDDVCVMNVPSTSTAGANSTEQAGLVRPNPFNRGKALRCCKCAKVIGSSLHPTGNVRYLTCDSCKLSTRQLTPAAATAVPTNRVYKCSDCSLKFDKFLHLLAHAVTHKKVFKCKLCNQATFVSPLLLREHMREHGFHFI